MQLNQLTLEDNFELTRCELLVCKLLVKGCTNDEMASSLFIEPKSVKWHFTKLFKKFKVRNRKQLREILLKATVQNDSTVT